MNVMGCLDQPDSGSYLLDGVDVAACTDRELSAIRAEKIGFIFQQFNLLEQMSALENVELPMVYRRIPKQERMERARGRAAPGGARLAHAPPAGPALRRAAAARGPSPARWRRRRPSSSPTSRRATLDSRSGDDVMRLITGLSQQGRTVVLITHNERVADMAHRTVYVRDGRLYGAREEADDA